MEVLITLIEELDFVVSTISLSCVSYIAFKSVLYKILVYNEKKKQAYSYFKEVYYDIEKEYNKQNLVELFKKAFICPQTGVWLFNPVIINNKYNKLYGISINSSTSTSNNDNSISSVYYNRNIFNLVEYIRNNKTFFNKNKEVYDFINETEMIYKKYK